MKKLVLTACALAGLVGTGFAGTWYQQHIGNFDYYHGSNGSSYTGQRIGNGYYWNGYDGCGNYHSGYRQRIGNSWYGYTSD